MKKHPRLLLTATITAVSFLYLPAYGQSYGSDAGGPAHSTFGQKEYSPYLDIGYPQRVFWGDTHVHTVYSTDAGMIGNRLGPDEAYRFARGETVVASSGVRARLQRPLDFLVISDHAENLGLAPMISEKNADLLKSVFGKKSRAWSMTAGMAMPMPCGVKA